MFGYIGGFFLGWGLGANDAANVFGTAVSSRMVSWRLAAVLASIFVVLGAVLQGDAGVETLSGLTSQSRSTATITVFAAACTVAMMTVLRLPISTSQAVVGSIVGVGIMQQQVNLGGLQKVVLCWLGTPVGGAAFYLAFHYLLRSLLRRFRPSLLTLDPLLRFGLVVCGCYGAYALGANNVANVSAVFVESGMLSSRWAVFLGGMSIAAGILSMSKPVMVTVGQRIAEMSVFSAFVVVLASSATVHLYAVIGVPVSTSQAVVGGLLGISLVRGLQVVRWRTMGAVFLAWCGTPLIGCGFAVLFYFLSHLQYQP